MPRIAFAIVLAITCTFLAAAVPAGAQDAKPKTVRSKPGQPVEIDGVPCSRATFWGEFFGRKYAVTEFHENGALAGCVASAAADIGGRHYAAGDRVTLDPDGQPVR